jgi:L-ascorbate metabolism protein UlaG (beta-lactamase superfamily)
VNILTDPVWTERASPFRWIGPKRVRPPGVELKALPRIDVILLSHNHYDHLDVRTLRSLSKSFSPVTLVPAGDKDLVTSTGLKNVKELDWWDEVRIGPDFKIVFAPSQHFSARNMFDRQKSLWGSFMVIRRGQLLYFGGDSAYSSHFREIKERLGAPDLALLGIGAYEPRWFMKSMHMNPEEAVQAHLDLSAKKSIGMHFGTFRLSAESFGSPKAELTGNLKKRGISERAFIILDDGETRLFPSFV